MTSNVKPANFYLLPHKTTKKRIETIHSLRTAVVNPLLIGLALVTIQHAVADDFLVRTESIARETVEHRVRTFGLLAPNVEELSFQISGRIEVLHAEEGDHVSAGEMLVTLEIKDAEDALRKAASELENAERLFNRMQALHETGSIQISQLDDARARYEQVQITHEQASLHLSRCYLSAPADGVLLKRYIDSRTSVSPGLPIFVFQRDDEQWVTEVELTDRNALLMSEGARAEISFSPYPEKVFAGTVSKVAKVANRQNGLFTAELVITTQDYELRPGMVAEVDLIRETEKEYAVVPFNALLEVVGNKGLVYLVSADRQVAVEQPVTIYNISGERVAVTEPLAEYSEVVTRGHHGLGNGSSIQVQDMPR